MNTKLVILGALAMLAAPLAYAHDPAGTPKNYCEPQADWAVHDYGPPATGSLILLNEDGNLAGDCDGTVTTDLGVPCVGVDPADPVNSFFVGLCDSDINPPIADYDGHREFALGGAWILVGSGPNDCFGGDEGHHAEFGYYAVEDVVLGNNALFSVTADTIDATGLNNPCGDFEADVGQNCVGACQVTIPAGLDRSYVIFVTGTQGHVIDGSGTEGDFIECSDGLDNDNDGNVDWPNDPGCDSPFDDDESTTSVCSDGIDNDGDGFIDFPTDPGCTTPGDNDESDPLPPLPPVGQINIHRFPGQTVGYRLITSPPGWTCVDVNTNGAVSSGSPLAGPNPGAQCTPPGGGVCNSVTVGGAHSGVGTGTIYATSKCAALQATQALTLPANAGLASSASPPLQPAPWTCSVDDSSASADSDYWIFCRVNL